MYYWCGYGVISFKALTCMKLFLYKQKLLFIEETDTFGHIVVWTIYTSHIDHFTPKHTAFEQSAACLSVFLELLPGLIPFAILRHAGCTLEKTICMIINYNYLTAIFRSILTQILCISGLFTFSFNLTLKNSQAKIEIYFFYQKFVHFGQKYF